MSHDRDHAPHDGDHAGHDHHRNPVDFERYLAKLESPERAAWQRPDEVVAALGLAPGALACDVGSGPGYFALRIARVVGPAGRVYGVDVEPRMLTLLEQRAREAGLENVVPVLAADGVPVPPEPCDAILLVNAFHHMPDPVGTLRRLAARLRPGGRIALVEFHEGELPVGPPPAHKVSRDAVLRAAAEAGLRLAGERTFLPYQYFLELAP